MYPAELRQAYASLFNQALPAVRNALAGGSR
jgi:hypothetical protein